MYPSDELRTLVRATILKQKSREQLDVCVCTLRAYLTLLVATINADYKMSANDAAQYGMDLLFGALFE